MTIIKNKEKTINNMIEIKGLNFFEEDKNLQFLLKRYISDKDYKKVEPALRNIGRDAGGPIDELSRLSDKRIPELIHYNNVGERVDEIVLDASYKKLEEFGHCKYPLVSMSHKENLLGITGEFPAVLKYTFWYIFGQAEFGVLCPMSMTDAAARVIKKFANKEIKEKYLPLLTSTEKGKYWTAGQFMTEKQGGSDVGANEVTAKLIDNEWTIWGDKWFSSNPGADMALVLARPENAQEGTRGLGLFLVARKLDDGSLNHYQINRLKDKLGTRNMPSGEIKFNGAKAVLIGDISNGFKQMMEMVNAARISNAVRSTGLIRRGFLESLNYTENRKAFGKPLAELPLMVETLFEQLIDSEASLSMILYASEVYGESESGNIEKNKLIRVLTPILKGYICKRARYLSGEAMEAKGGNGYIEDWVNPKIVRDAHLGSVWEGTTNILALDILRAFSKDKVHDVLFKDIYKRLDDISDSNVRKISNIVSKLAKETYNQTLRILELERNKQEWTMKNLMNRLYHLLAISLLIEEADYQIKQEGSYRKLYISAEYLVRHLLSSGFDDYNIENGELLNWFHSIIKWENIPERAISNLISNIERLYGTNI